MHKIDNRFKDGDDIALIRLDRPADLYFVSTNWSLFLQHYLTRSNKLLHRMLEKRDMLIPSAFLGMMTILATILHQILSPLLDGDLQVEIGEKILKRKEIQNVSEATEDKWLQRDFKKLRFYSLKFGHLLAS